MWRCAPCANKLTRRWRKKRDLVSNLYASAKWRAKEQGLQFTITPADVERVMPSDKRCPILGLVLRPGKGKCADGSPTLDRVNDSWGYTPDNIAVISFAANRAKGKLTAEQLERLAAWMRSKGLN